MDDVRSDVLVGRVLDGRYRVVSWLAQGGMATVYSAIDLRLDRLVALKVPHPALAADESFLSRFIGEAKAAARLSSPNVVAVYDQGATGPDAGAAAGKDHPIVYLVMEYVPGRTLRDELSERGPLSPGDALHVAEAIASALAAAHAAGLVHRDVKPENVLLAEDGGVKVADFGLARAVDGVTSTTQGLLLGTASYVAPEQVQNGVADPRSDVYAAGIVLYEMLAGAPPYTGDSTMAVAYRHVHEDVPAPSALVPDLPPELDEIVLAATRRSPDERPADGAALVALMRSAVGATAVTGRVGAARESRQPVPAAAPSGALATSTIGLPAAAASGRHMTNPPLAAPVSGAQHTVAIPVLSGSTPGGPLLPRRPVESDPGGDEPQNRPRGPLVAGLVLTAAALAAALVWAFMYGPFAYTRTPALVGLTEKKARTVAEAAGLHVGTKSQFSEVVPSGEVISSDPGPGASISKKGTVTLVLSKGKERYEVPDLRGRTVREAQDDLRNARLSLGEQEEQFSTSVSEGVIISSTPAAGADVKRGTTVSIVVSKGVPPITVPSVVGLPLALAQAQLESRGLDVRVTRRADDTVQAELVLEQDPAGEERVGPGTTVRLTVSSGPNQVQVPDVRGRGLDEAVQLLTNAGFEVQTEGPQALRIARDTNPPAGTLLPRGSAVRLRTL